MATKIVSWQIYHQYYNHFGEKAAVKMLPPFMQYLIEKFSMAVFYNEPGRVKLMLHRRLYHVLQGHYVEKYSLLYDVTKKCWRLSDAVNYITVYEGRDEAKVVDMLEPKKYL